MTEYVFTGEARLRGVEFYIVADTLEEAKARAKRGEQDSIEDYNAEMYDWKISVESGKENK